jgi:hypothetical protein
LYQAEKRQIKIEYTPQHTHNTSSHGFVSTRGMVTHMYCGPSQFRPFSIGTGPRIATAVKLHIGTGPRIATAVILHIDTGPRSATAVVLHIGTGPRSVTAVILPIGTGPRIATAVILPIGTGPRSATTVILHIGTGPRPSLYVCSAVKRYWVRSSTDYRRTIQWGEVLYCKCQKPPNKIFPEKELRSYTFMFL